MNTALFIHSYAKANDIVQRHWSYYERSGFDIFGIGRTNTLCKWPKSMRTKDIGLDSYINGDNLCRRLVDTFDWFITDPIFQMYSHACVIEYDSVFIRPPPQIEIHVAAHLAGGRPPGSKATRFFHCPWWLSREQAQRFVQHGNELLRAGEYEGGTPDFFFARVFEDLKQRIEHLHGTFSQNTIEKAQFQKECRTLIEAGIVWFVHGIKTPEQLKAIVP